MDVTGFMAGGAVLAVLTSCWAYVKAFFWRIISLFIQRVEISTEDMHFPIVWHLLDNYKMSPIYDKVYGANYEYRVDGKYGLVAYEFFGKQTLIFWKKMWWIFKVPIVLSRVGNAQATGGQDNGKQNTGGNSNENGVFSHITILRWTVDLDKLLSTACADKNKLAWEQTDNFLAGCRRFFIKRLPENKQEGATPNLESNQLAWYRRRHFRLLSEEPNNLGRRNPSKQSSLDMLIFPRHIKDLIEEVKLWRVSRTWYQERGIPWKRGWNLYGPPGTGKTALARAFAEDLDLPLFVFNLAEFNSNSEFIKEWTSMQANVPCIALIEDIDNVFHGRENITTKRMFGGFGYGLLDDEDTNVQVDRKTGKKKHGADEGGGTGRFGVTFDCLLNCLDGVERNEGVFLIITTNDLTKIDPALGQPRKNHEGKSETISTRPGRIDKAIELTYITQDNKVLMAKRIMGDYPEELAEMMQYIENNPQEEETPAQFQERCSQIALARYWADSKKENAFILHETEPEPQHEPAKSLEEAWPSVVPADIGDEAPVPDMNYVRGRIQYLREECPKLDQTDIEELTFLQKLTIEHQ